MKHGTPMIVWGAVAVTAGLTTAAALHQPPPQAAAKIAPFVPPGGPLAGVFVVLDPGHGGADPGTTCGPLPEAALTYRTAVELASSLQAQGAHVIYTVRSRDLDLALATSEPPLEQPSDAVMAATGEALRPRRSARPLWQRAAVGRTLWLSRLAKDPHAARDVFFLSLHFDQSSAADIHGGTVCVDRRCRPVPALAKDLAAQMAADDLGRTGDFLGTPGLAGRELGVLDPAYNPVPEKALLELATLSNSQDAIEASDPVWRAELVRRITIAITQAHQR